jgi:hypothetical protein
MEKQNEQARAGRVFWAYGNSGTGVVIVISSTAKKITWIRADVDNDVIDGKRIVVPSESRNGEFGMVCELERPVVFCDADRQAILTWAKKQLRISQDCINIWADLCNTADPEIKQDCEKAFDRAMRRRTRFDLVNLPSRLR